MSVKTSKNQRKFYRLQLPTDELIRIRIAGLGGRNGTTEFWVDEISERTLRVTTIIEDFEKPECRGIIYWSSVPPSAFEGRIGPLRGKRQLILGVVGITLADMVREQRRLINNTHYGHEKRHMLD